MVKTKSNLKYCYFKKFISGTNIKNIYQLANMQIRKFYLHFIYYITD